MNGPPASVAALRILRAASPCCCPCITFGQNAEIIDLGTTSWVTAGLVYLLLAPVCCSWAYTWTYRRKLRIMYGLKEGPCADYIVHCCCQFCAVSQEYRELQNHGFDPSVGWIANADRLNLGGARPMAPPPTATPMAR
ncbi:cell number regulator 2-like [Hibiscus syriacus]|nr:cell number regulator 2-like [Hibiscus syriacus]